MDFVVKIRRGKKLCVFRDLLLGIFLLFSFRRNQEWQALEYKVREDLMSKSLERILSLNRKKDR